MKNKRLPNFGNLFLRLKEEGIEMTESEKIVANLYERMLETVFLGFKLAADAAEDVDDLNRAEALRWLSDNRRMPQIGPTSGYGKPNWGWCLSSKYPFALSALDELDATPLVGMVGHNFWNSFEEAIEAFIQAWPEIKPKCK